LITNPTEQESIILNTAWQMIDDMVNRSVFVGFQTDEPTTLLPQTREHALLFVVLLRDFPSEIRAFGKSPLPMGLRKPPPNSRPSDRTFIFHLRQVCAAPRLGTDPSALSCKAEDFAHWLEGSFEAKGVNLGDIDLVCDLRVERYRYIRMCGDIAKHSLPRLSVNARHLRKLLRNAGHEVTEEESYLAIPNFLRPFLRRLFHVQPQPNRRVPQRNPLGHLRLPPA